MFCQIENKANDNAVAKTIAPIAMHACPICEGILLSESTLETQHSTLFFFKHNTCTHLLVLIKLLKPY